MNRPKLSLKNLLAFAGISLLASTAFAVPKAAESADAEVSKNTRATYAKPQPGSKKTKAAAPDRKPGAKPQAPKAPAKAMKNGKAGRTLHATTPA